jgi:hypothetical protein
MLCPKLESNWKIIFSLLQGAIGMGLHTNAASVLLRMNFPENTPNASMQRSLTLIVKRVISRHWKEEHLPSFEEWLKLSMTTVKFEKYDCKCKWESKGM